MSPRRLTTDYHITIVRGTEPADVRPTGGANKRVAIRECRHFVRQGAPPIRGEVRTEEGTLIYQCHQDMAGKLVVDEL